MSHIRVKTTYESEGSYGSTEIHTLYCHHNNSCDCTTYYDERGNVMSMSFCSFTSGKDLWDAMERLWYPWKENTGQGEYKDGVEHWGGKPPWEEEIFIAKQKEEKEKWDKIQYEMLKKKFENT